MCYFFAGLLHSAADPADQAEKSNLDARATNPAVFLALQNRIGAENEDLQDHHYAGGDDDAWPPT